MFFTRRYNLSEMEERFEEPQTRPPVSPDVLLDFKGHKQRSQSSKQASKQTMRYAVQ